MLPGDAGARHRLGARPQPFAGRTFVSVESGRSPASAGRQGEDDTVDDKRRGRGGEVVRDPAGLERERAAGIHQLQSDHCAGGDRAIRRCRNSRSEPSACRKQDPRRAGRLLPCCQRVRAHGGARSEQGLRRRERRGMIRSAERRRVEQQHASVLRRRGHDVPIVVPEDRRAGDELRRRLREPVLQLQRLRVERDDRVRLAVAGGLARTDRRDERPVLRERDGADDCAAVGLPRHDRFGVAIKIDRPDAVGCAAALPRCRRVERRAHRDGRGPLRVRGQERRRPLDVLAGRRGRARAACRRSRRRSSRRTAGTESRTDCCPPLPAARRECDRRPGSRRTAPAPVAAAWRRARPVRLPEVRRARAGAAGDGSPPRPGPGRHALRPAHPHRARRGGCDNPPRLVPCPRRNRPGPQWSANPA